MKNHFKIGLIVLIGLSACGVFSVNAVEEKSQQFSTEAIKKVLHAIKDVNWCLFVQEHKNDNDYHAYVLSNSKICTDSYNFLTNYLPNLKPVDDVAKIPFNYIAFERMVYEFLSNPRIISNTDLKKDIINFLNSTYITNLYVQKKITREQYDDLSLLAYNLLRDLFNMKHSDQINYELISLVMDFAIDKATEQEVLEKDAALEKQEAEQQKKLKELQEQLQKVSISENEKRQEDVFKKSQSLTELERAQEISHCLENKKELCIPTLAQQNFVEYAGHIAGIKDPVYVFSHLPHDFSAYATMFDSTPGIVLPIRHSRERNTFNIFHELGHIAQMHVTGKEIKNLFTRDEIKNFIALGEQAFDDSTELGRHMNGLMKKYGLVHSILQKLGLSSPQEYRISLFSHYDPEMPGFLESRYVESNADLFAAKKLYSMHDFDPIFNEIKLESNDLSLENSQISERDERLIKEAVEDFCIADFIGSLPGCKTLASWLVSFVYLHSHVFNFDVLDFHKEQHPSGFETALYLAGFLVNKLGKEKFNQLIKDWEEKGKDYDFELQPMLHHQFKSPLAQMTKEQLKEHFEAQKILKPYEASLLL